jgi:hypothetical protein
VVASHVSSCAYAFQSIYASSNLAEGSLADYHRPDDSQYRLRWGDYADDEDDRERHLLKVVPTHKLFGEAGELSWASQDKLCQLSGSQINVVRYTPWNDAKTRWQQLGIVTLPKAHGEVVSAGVAPFGIVIEQDDALTVLPSQGKPITFPGEVTRWRCFPRSKWYENQLHILYEDRLDVWSFNQDYFVDQSEKLAGTSVSTRAMALEAARR